MSEEGENSTNYKNYYLYTFIWFWELKNRRFQIRIELMTLKMYATAEEYIKRLRVFFCEEFYFPEKKVKFVEIKKCKLSLHQCR